MLIRPDRTYGLRKNGLRPMALLVCDSFTWLNCLMKLECAQMLEVEGAGEAECRISGTRPGTRSVNAFRLHSNRTWSDTFVCIVPYPSGIRQPGSRLRSKPRCVVRARIRPKILPRRSPSGSSLFSLAPPIRRLGSIAQAGIRRSPHGPDGRRKPPREPRRFIEPPSALKKRCASTTAANARITPSTGRLPMSAISTGSFRLIRDIISPAMRHSF